jgi:hypothetical protein
LKVVEACPWQRRTNKSKPTYRFGGYVFTPFDFYSSKHGLPRQMITAVVFAWFGLPRPSNSTLAGYALQIITVEFDGPLIQKL